MPARRGRGQGGKPGAAAPHAKNTKSKFPVAAPAVAQLPESLTIPIHSSTLPEILRTGLTQFDAIQPYWSGLEKLMPESAGTHSIFTNCWTGVSGELISDIQVSPESNFYGTLRIQGEEKPIFIKRIHLLDATRAMEGEYIWPRDGALPAPSELWKTALAKINDPLNEAYVDALFALCADRLVRSGISPHWCLCYGTFTARAKTYMYDITDDYHDLRSEPWWKRNQRQGLFTLVKSDDDDLEDDTKFFTSGISEIADADFQVIDADAPGGDEQCEVEEVEPALQAEVVNLKKPSMKIEKLETGDDSDSEEDEEIQHQVAFENFPVQVSLLECADGTIDELLDAEDENDVTMASTKEERWSAWLFQVIAALTAAQYYYGFVHNDLHANNIMWSGTGLTHIWYKVVKGKTSYMMRVPTFGRIMKIIDFGRSTYTLPEPAGFIMSDAFCVGNDAGHQYNCEPYYDQREKRVEPNPSFDLGRLAVSLLEALYPQRPEAVSPVKIMSREGAKLYTETVSPVYNLLWGWLQDDNGKNILRNADGTERYPDFDLYRALAAEVHHAVPKEMVEKEVFSRFRVSEKLSASAEDAIYVLNI